MQVVFVSGVGVNRGKVDGDEIAAQVEVTRFIEDIGGAPGHAGAEVDAGGTENHDFTACHVFAAVVADAFHDHGDAGIADPEAFAGLAVHEDSTAGRTVGDDVACDDVVFGTERRFTGRLDRDDAAGESLADEIIGFACEVEGYARAEESPEGLTGCAVEVDGDRIIGESAVLCGDFAGEFSSHGAVGVADRAVEGIG